MTKKSIIFIVDDDLVFLEMMEEAINFDRNYQIFTFQSGEDCLQNLHLKPDIVVLDYNLNAFNPDAINGAEVLHKLKPELPQTQIIMLSGQDDLDIIYEVNKLNVSDYIIKGRDTFQIIPRLIRDLLD